MKSPRVLCRSLPLLTRRLQTGTGLQGGSRASPALARWLCVLGCLLYLPLPAAYAQKKKPDVPDSDCLACHAQPDLKSEKGLYKAGATLYPEESGRGTQSDAVAAVYLRDIFPEMKVTWGVHPSNLGHNDFPGCFRCHDGSHSSADGQTISNDCAACRNLMAVQEENQWS